MERKERKGVRLHTYDYSQNGVYFVTLCAKDRKKLFGEIVGDGALDVPTIRLSAVGEVIDKYIKSTHRIPGVTVEKYVIMPNHLHLLIGIHRDDGTSRAPSPTDDCTPPACNPSVAPHNQLLPHTIATLKRFVHRDVGYTVFQRSYYDHVVRGEQDYREIWEYIDQNPQKWQQDRFFVCE